MAKTGPAGLVATALHEVEKDGEQWVEKSYVGNNTRTTSWVIID